MTLVCQNDIYIGDKKTVSALTNLILKNVSNKMLNAGSERISYAGY